MAADLSIIDRLFDASTGGFSPGLATFVLDVDFTAAEQARFADLSDRVQLGGLSDAERDELEGFLLADAVLTVLQSKARTSLRSLKPTAA